MICTQQPCGYTIRRLAETVKINATFDGTSEDAANQIANLADLHKIRVVARSHGDNNFEEYPISWFEMVFDDRPNQAFGSV